MCFSILSIAQVNQLGINYQAQIRNSSGVLLADSSVTLRFSLLPGQFATTPTWKEQYTVQTDNYGMIHLVIGQGTKLSGTVATFDLVDFTSAGYWLKTELGVGASFSTLSNEPFQSVPYAKVAGNATLFPPGFIMPFAGDSTKIPNGWLLCDGREIPRSQYSALYEVIADNWGRGNNSTTFNIPDLRGTFMRGVNYNSGNDPDSSASIDNGLDGKRFARYSGGNVGNKVGSYQLDAFQGHHHKTMASASGTLTNGSQKIARQNIGGDNQESLITFDPVTDGVHGTPRISVQTRPINVYVNFLIKY